MTAYATTEDLQKGWRYLSPSELYTAEELISRASVLIDKAIDDYSLNPSSAIKKIVCCDMVRLSFHYGTEGAYYGDVAESVQSMSEGSSGGPLKVTDNQLSMLGYKKVAAGIIPIGTYDDD